MVGTVGEGAEQGAGAAGGVEDGGGGAGEGGHEVGDVGRGERVLARVGVEVPAEQELEGGAGAPLGGEFGDAAQEGDGGEQAGAVGMSRAGAAGAAGA